MFTLTSALHALRLIPPPEKQSARRLFATEWDSRSSSKHLLALAIVVAVCAALSSLSLPTVQSFEEVAREQHVAYGYFYFPVIAVPILASWLREPWGDLQPSPRRAYADVLWRSFLVLLMTVTSTLLGSVVEGAQTGLLCAENALWCTVLVLLVLPIGFEVACLAPMIYGAVGLFSTSWPGLVINRDPSSAELITGILLSTALCAAPLGRLLQASWSDRHQRH